MSYKMNELVFSQTLNTITLSMSGILLRLMYLFTLQWHCC